MLVSILEATVHGDAGCTSEFTRKPTWEDAEGAIRRLDRDTHPDVYLHVVDIGRDWDELEHALSILGGAGAALLYAENLTDAFFDLSSRQAGAILQKLRNYGVRLAVVCPAGTVQFSRRFGEVLAEERRGRFFGAFDTRREAVEWLRRRSMR